MSEPSPPDSLRYMQLSSTVAASPQVLPEHMPAIADAGYRVVINNRPDGESQGQPTSAQLEAAATSAGLSYHYYPLNAYNYPGDDLEAMAALFDGEAPVFAFCRSGTRSANLWISSRAPDERDAARAAAQRIGFDVTMSLAS